MVLWLTCTHNRYRCLQRNLRCFLDQEYSGEVVMFICNTGSPMKLVDGLELPSNKHIYIDNCLVPFTSVGEKFQHAFELAKRLYPEIDVVISADDDDVFLPTHLAHGVDGLSRALDKGCLAYKPYYSYYRERRPSGIVYEKIHNTLEPSIFIDADYLCHAGFASVSVRYHQQWLDPLQEKQMIFVDPTGEPTLIYNWGDNGGEDSWNIYKMSGTGDDSIKNFISHSIHSQDKGSNILTPTETNEGYYNFIQ